MSVDWGSVLTGGLTGGAAGAAAGGIGAVPGALIGAGAGLINGIFGGGEDAPSYQKYSDPYTNAIISKMMNSKLGETAAAHTAGELRSQARDQFEQLQNNPNLAGNTSALAALNNRLQRQAETGIAGANIAGAQQDQQSQEQGAQLQNQQNQFSLQRNQFEMERNKSNRQPTFTQDLFGKGVNAVIGAALGKQFATNPADKKNGIPDVAQPDQSKMQIPSLFPQQNNAPINVSGQTPASGSGEDSGGGLSGGINLAPIQNNGFNGIDSLRSIRPQATGYSPSPVGY